MVSVIIVLVPKKTEPNTATFVENVSINLITTVTTLEIVSVVTTFTYSLASF